MIPAAYCLPDPAEVDLRFRTEGDLHKQPLFVIPGRPAYADLAKNRIHYRVSRTQSFRQNRRNAYLLPGSVGVTPAIHA